MLDRLYNLGQLPLYDHQGMALSFNERETVTGSDSVTRAGSQSEPGLVTLRDTNLFHDREVEYNAG